MTTPQTRKPRTLATAEQFEGLTVMQMTVKNVKAVRYIDVTFDDTMTIVGGDNAQGKSSFLGSYDWLFGGREAIDDDPIRHGEAEGFIEGKFGDGKTVQLAVKRTLQRVGEKNYASEVEIEIPGFIAPSQRETFLKKLVNPIAVDPMAFDRMSAEERAETFQKLVPFDFKANKQQHDAIYKTRTEVNRDLKTAQGALASLVVSDKPPCESIDEAAIVQELQDAGTKNADIALRKTNREQAEVKIALLRTEAAELLAGVDAAIERETARAQAFIDDCERQIKELQERIARTKADLGVEIGRIQNEVRELAQAKMDDADALQTRLQAAPPLEPIIDVDAIRARLEEAKTKNKQVDAWQQLRDRKLEQQAKIDALQTESDELTAELAELEQQKTAAIQQAHLPIDGLGFVDGVVTFNGVPWEQASEAERIDASMSIAMALTPKLKNIIIRDASGVGSKIKQRIRDRARAAGYKVILEILDESGANSTVHIEDGVVKALAQKAEEAAA